MPTSRSRITATKWASTPSALVMVLDQEEQDGTGVAVPSRCPRRHRFDSPVGIVRPTDLFSLSAVLMRMSRPVRVLSPYQPPPSVISWVIRTGTSLPLTLTW